MKFIDRPLVALRYNKSVEVENLRMPSYSKAECDLTFMYTRGEEERRIDLSLTRDEAKELLSFMETFLNDKDYDEDV